MVKHKGIIRKTIWYNLVHFDRKTGFNNSFSNRLEYFRNISTGYKKFL